MVSSRTGGFSTVGDRQWEIGTGDAGEGFVPRLREDGREPERITLQVKVSNSVTEMLSGS